MCIRDSYNYLFDPVVYLKRFFGESPGEYVFLVDEAHNLVDRSRDMYSAALHKSIVLQARRLVGKEERKLFRALGAVNTEMLTLRKACGESRTPVSYTHLDVYKRQAHFLRSHRLQASKDLRIDQCFFLAIF